VRDIAALIAFIDGHQNVPHEWGSDKNDCVSFCLGAIEAQTGARLTKRKWSSKESGLRMLKRLGGMEAVIDRYLERIPPSLAKRGDVGGVPDELLGISPAIVEGETLVAPGPRGNRRLKRKAMAVAWSVDKLK
jgi:hypothetical protein